MRVVRNWRDEIEALNKSKSGERVIIMGSPGSAQVTRVRVLAEYDGIEATTKGVTLTLRLK